jgi:hypothetical protein
LSIGNYCAVDKTTPRYSKNYSAVLNRLDLVMGLCSLRSVALFPSVLFLPSYAGVFCAFSLYKYFNVSFCSFTSS